MAKKKEQEAKAEKKEAKAEKKEPKRGVGTVAKEAIRAGKTNEEALEIVKKEFPDAKTTMASINWYRNNLRTNGENVPTARELQKKKKDAEGSSEKGKEKAKEKDPTA